MHVSGPWLVLLIVALALFVLGAVAGVLRERSWVSEPMICLGVGALAGQAGAGLMRLDPVAHPIDLDFLRETARFTVAIAVLGAAIRLPKGWLWRNWRGLAVAIGPGMLLMWATTTGVLTALLALPPLQAALIGAVLTPTDPVLSSTILTGRLAERTVPTNLRAGITAESGANDGLALPFVMAPLILSSEPLGPGIRDWLADAVLWQLGSAVAVGALLGWFGRRVHGWARARRDAERTSLITIALALAVASLAAVQLLDGDGVLAAFVAGLAYNEGLEGEIEERHHAFGEAITRFFDLPVIILFGMALPWADWAALGWTAPFLILGVLLLRRLPAWLLLARAMPWLENRRETMFAGWFGPIGAAALFYALDALEKTGVEEIWTVTSLVVAASIVAHGASATPFSRWLARGARGGAEADRRTAVVSPP